MSRSDVVGHIAVCAALAYWFGQTLDKRVELTSPIHSLISLREASFWLSVGRSPFTSSLVRTPPLLVYLFEHLARHRLLLTGVLSVLNCLASRLLSALSARLLQHKHDQDARELIQTAASLYLLNPLLVLSTAAASTASVNNLALTFALYGAFQGSASAAGLGIAVGTYLSIHNIILLVPLSLLVRHFSTSKGSPSKSCNDGGHTTTDTTAAGTTKQRLHKQLSEAVPCVKHFLFWSVCLLLLSDIQLRHHMDHYKTSFVQYIIPEPGRTYSRPAGAQAAVHWTAHVYGYMIKAPENSPNIGMWWYFFAEVFPSWREPFKIAFIAAWLVPPLLLTKKLCKDPLLLFTCHCIIISLLKPHPTVADAAMFMALLPLFPHLLRRLPSGVFTMSSLLMLACLSPAMWHLWMDLEAANANFFYAITLLWAAWQVMLLLQLLTAAGEHEGNGNQGLDCDMKVPSSERP